MKETPSMCEQYVNLVITKRHEITASLAAQEPDDDVLLDEAIYFDTLYNYPTPWESKDDHPHKGSVLGDNTEYDEFPPAA